MPLTINTNSAAAKANMHLDRNNDMLRKSLNRLSSGSPVVQASMTRWIGGLDETGGTITRLSETQINVSKCHIISRGVPGCDGVMDAAGKILNRMIELKGA